MNAERIGGLYGIVLAAGRSSRLGHAKQSLTFRGETLIARAVRHAQAVCDEGVGVVLGANRDTHVESLARHAVAVIDNAAWQEGLATSIRAGIQAVPETARGALLTLVDQINITDDALRRLGLVWSEAPEKIVASHYAGTLGVPAVFPRVRFDDLAALSGDRGAKDLLLRAGEAVLSVNLPEAAFDIDTAEDLARLIADV